MQAIWIWCMAKTIAADAHPVAKSSHIVATSLKPRRRAAERSRHQSAQQPVLFQRIDRFLGEARFSIDVGGVGSRYLLSDTAHRFDGFRERRQRFP